MYNGFLTTYFILFSTSHRDGLVSCSTLNTYKKLKQMTYNNTSAQGNSKMNEDDSFVDIP